MSLILTHWYYTSRRMYTFSTETWPHFYLFLSFTFLFFFFPPPWRRVIVHLYFNVPYMQAKEIASRPCHRCTWRIEIKARIWLLIWHHTHRWDIKREREVQENFHCCHICDNDHIMKSQWVSPGVEEVQGRSNKIRWLQNWMFIGSKTWMANIGYVGRFGVMKLYTILANFWSILEVSIDPIFKL